MLERDRALIMEAESTTTFPTPIFIRGKNSFFKQKKKNIKKKKEGKPFEVVSHFSFIFKLSRLK